MGHIYFLTVLTTVLVVSSACRSRFNATTAATTTTTQTPSTFNPKHLPTASNAISTTSVYEEDQPDNEHLDDGYLDYADYDTNATAYDETQGRGGFTHTVVEGMLPPCRPRIQLCRRSGNRRPTCKNGRYWIRIGWPNADKWMIQTPYYTGKDQKNQSIKNCCFKLHQYPHLSIQGEVIEIKPGTKKTIGWNIKS